MRTSDVAVLRPWVAVGGDKGVRLYMWCPACEDVHGVELDAATGPKWDYNDDLSAPTISPSIKVEGVQWELGHTFHKPRHHVGTGEPICCHSFVRAGRWEFLSDCTHDLAGQTVDLPSISNWPGHFVTNLAAGGDDVGTP